MEAKFFEEITKRTTATLTESFYPQVLNTMIDRLDRDGRYRSKWIEWETLEKLKKRVKEHLEDPAKLFQVASKYKEGVTQDDFIQKQLIAFDQIETEMRAQSNIQEANKRIEIEKELEERGDSQYFYLIDSNFQRLNHAECEKKEEPTFSTLVKTQENNPQNDSSDSSSDSNESNFRTNIQPNYEYFTGNKIVGTIDRSHFKYNLKKNKYIIRLTDVFIKTMEGEVYLNEMNVETEKMEKSMIPPQFQHK